MQAAQEPPSGGFYIVYRIRKKMFGYIDESGTPGLVQGKGTDFLLVCLVVIKNRDTVVSLSRGIDDLRAETRLPDDFEFHFAYNINPAKANFIKFIEKSDFEFITVAIQKNQQKRFGTYANLATYLSSEIIKRYPGISLEMDTNPTLYQQLRLNFRAEGAHIRIKQCRSRGHNLIQFTDYVTALAARSLKKPEKCQKEFAKIRKHCATFVLVK